ncbi:WD40-repeat-containing domain protein [Xylariaceae sp. FL0594]|nr:WD40-repeat-containing domain protein [Xylariaceae sp. FL0594]
MGLVPDEDLLPVLPVAGYNASFMSSASSYSHDTGMEAGGHTTSRRPTTATPFRPSRSLSTCLQWRRQVQPKPLVLGCHDIALARGINELAIEEGKQAPSVGGTSNTSNTSKNGATSFTRRLRRASLTLMKGIVGRDRSNSEPAADMYQSRPVTSHSTWNRFRQATHMRPPKTSHGDGPGLDTIYSPLESEFPVYPVPGNGFAPPIIPEHTGAAAKASAAAFQQEFVSLATRQHSSTEEFNDQESGIGIAVTVSDPSQNETTARSDSDVARVDFIQRLPHELSVHILASLDAAQLGAVSRVSRRWHAFVQDQYIWRQSFLRLKTQTYAGSGPIQPGTMAGVPTLRHDLDWRKIYQARVELDHRWKNTSQPHAVYLNGHLDSIYCLQFDENKIITGSRDKTLRIWDLRTLQCRLVIGPPEVVNESFILFDPNGKPVHYASTRDNIHSNPSVPVTVSFPVHHKASVLCLQYDDEILVTGSSDSTCIIYSVKAGYRPIRRLRHHTAAVLDLAFDEKHIVTCSKDKSICVWDREMGALLKELQGHTGPVNSVELRGNTILSCSGDYSARLWNMNSGKTIREFTGHKKGLACCQFSEDGRFVISAGSDRVIRIWDANTGECLREMVAHESLVRSLHLDSASGRLISGSYDTDLKVFDVETGEQIVAFPHWHASWVLSAKCDYRRIISTGQDPKILIMDFGADVENIQMLESERKHEVACEAGFI